MDQAIADKAFHHYGLYSLTTSRHDHLDLALSLGCKPGHYNVLNLSKY